MALIYKATLEPSKLQLLTAYVGHRPWFDGIDLEQVGAYRFDDPAGEVGIEGHVLQSGDQILHVPVTYRGAPLSGAGTYLIGTTEHSVLGRRWVYDACGDPAWAAALANALITGAPQSVEHIDGLDEPREPSVRISTSGSTDASLPEVGAIATLEEGPTTVVHAGGLQLVVSHVVGTEIDAQATLVGSWADGSGVLAGLR